MVWTGQTFSVGQILTAAQMTNLQNDISAAFAKDSGAPQLANDYIVNAMIATDAVNADSIVADAVGTSEITADAVTANEIATGAVGQSEIAANSVGNSEMLSDAIDTAELVDGAVSLAKMDSDSVDSTKLTAVTAGTYYTAAFYTGASNQEVSYTEELNFRIIQAGTYRISFGIRTSDVADNAYARIYKNGVAEGTQRAGTVTTYTYYTEDITFAAGDTFQMFIRHGSASYTAIVNYLKFGCALALDLFILPLPMEIGDR